MYSFENQLKCCYVRYMDDDDDDEDNNDDNNNNSNNVKAQNVYSGIRIKMVAHIVRKYLSDRKNLLGDRKHTMLPVLPKRRQTGYLSCSTE
jgi:hypothetical protein